MEACLLLPLLHMLVLLLLPALTRAASSTGRIASTQTLLSIYLAPLANLGADRKRGGQGGRAMWCMT